MPRKRSFLPERVRYLINRARNIQPLSVWRRAKKVSHTHKVSVIGVIWDMLWQASFHEVGFQDYVDYDFAILTRSERATYMTHPLSNRISQKYNTPAFRHLFHNKIHFNKRFASFLRRDWLALDETTAPAFARFVAENPVFVAKNPFGHAGIGVHRYRPEDYSDTDDLHAALLERGETLVEEVIEQHADLARYCPGTANTTRVTTFFDGQRSHILAMAQKFGRGQVSDQMSFGGFYTMLNDDGHACGAGYDSYGRVHVKHPDSGLPIAEFTLPQCDQVREFVAELGQVVPEIAYVGWDIVVTADGPVLVEGNWAVGVYENKPSVTGIRHGNKARYRDAIGFTG